MSPPEIAAPPARKRSAAQFSLRSILLLTFLVGVFCGLIVAEQYVGVYLFTMLVAAGAMCVDIIRGQVYRGGAVALLAIAIAYALCTIALLAILDAIDSSSILGMGFVFVVAAGPVLTFGVVIVTGIATWEFHWFTVAGFMYWILGVWFASMTIIANSSASV